MKVFQITLAAALATISLSLWQPVYAETQTAETPSRHSLADSSDKVMFNENSKKYHALSCAHLAKCTHCVEMKRSEAKAKGGVPCKTCRGGE